MDHDRKALCHLLIVEFVALLIFTVSTVLYIENDEGWAPDHLLFTFTVYAFLLVIIMATWCFYVRSRGKKSSKRKNRLTPTDYGKMSSRLKLVDKKFGSDCAICLTSKDVQYSPIAELSCKHDYHEQCIRDWFITSAEFRCPQCREIAEPLPDGSQNTSHAGLPSQDDKQLPYSYV